MRLPFSILTLFLIAICLIFTAGCDAQESDNETNSNEEVSVANEAASTPIKQGESPKVKDKSITLPDSFVWDFQGAIIGETPTSGTPLDLPISMRLFKGGDHLWGVYWYEDIKIPIILDGNVEGNSLKVYEYGGPSPTASFTGKFESPRNASGDWNSMSGEKTWEFTLKGMPEGSLRRPGFPQDSLVAKWPHLNANSMTRWPKMGEMGLPIIKAWLGDYADTLQNRFQRSLEDWDPGNGTYGGSEQITDIDIFYQDKSVISLRENTYAYFEGAAHPSHNTSSTLWRRKTQEQIPFRALFNESLDLNALQLMIISRLSGQMFEDIEESDEWVRRGTTPIEGAYETFFVSPEGLTIQFDEYEVASYAEGPQDCTIPWIEISDWIDPNGPAGHFIPK